MHLGLVCMTLGIGFESSKEIKGFGGIFFGNIYIILVGLIRRNFWVVFGSRKIQYSSSPFWCHNNQQVCSPSE